MEAQDIQLAIEQFKHGDKETRNLAFKRLSQFVRPHALSAIRRYGSRFDVEDLLQEADISLMRVIEDFDINRVRERGNNPYLAIRPYFSLTFCSRLQNLYTLSNADMRRPNYVALSLDNEADSGASIKSLLHAKAETCLTLPDDEAASLRRNLKSILSKYEYAVFVANVFSNETYAQIADRIGSTIKSVDNGITRGKKKLKEIVERRGIDFLFRKPKAGAFGAVAEISDIADILIC